MAKTFEMRGRFLAHHADFAAKGYFGARAPANAPSEEGTAGVWGSAHIDFSQGAPGTKFVGWPGNDNWPNTNDISIRWYLDPGFTGAPVGNEESLLTTASGLEAFEISGLDIAIDTSGNFRASIYEGDFSTIAVLSIAGLSFTAGTKTEIMFTYAADGSWALSQDGVQVAVGTASAFSVDRNNRNVVSLGIGRGNLTANPIYHKLYNLEIWDTIEPHVYTPRTDFDDTPLQQPELTGPPDPTLPTVAQVTAVEDITTAMLAELALQFDGTTYKPLDYLENVQKNTFRGNNNRYGVRALVASQLPGVTKNVTLNQEFEIILTQAYLQSKINDDQQVAKSLDLRAEMLAIYKRFINRKAGLPGIVLNISDFILSEPEYLEDDKVVVQRATMNIQYRYSLI